MTTPLPARNSSQPTAGRSRPDSPAVRRVPRERKGELVAELGRLRAGQGSRKQLGDFSEAVAVGLAVGVNKHDVLQQHAPGLSSHGLDVQTIDPAGKTWAFEVKGTGVSGKLPSGTRYPVGRQSGGEYVADRSASGQVRAAAATAVGPAFDQMGSLLVQVNIADDEITVWDVDAVGRRAQSPTERHSLTEVITAIERWNEV